MTLPMQVLHNVNSRTFTHTELQYTMHFTLACLLFGFYTKQFFYNVIWFYTACTLLVDLVEYYLLVIYFTSSLLYSSLLTYRCFDALLF